METDRSGLTSNLARWHEARYDMAVIYFERKEYAIAREILLELTQDAYTPLLFKCYSFFLLAQLGSIFMALINIERARDHGEQLQEGIAKTTFLDEVSTLRNKLVDLDMKRKAALAEKSSKESETATNIPEVVEEIASVPTLPKSES